MLILPFSAPHTLTFRKMLELARVLGAPDPEVIFELGGRQIPKFEIRRWLLSAESGSFRAIPEAELLIYLDGLKIWCADMSLCADRDPQKNQTLGESR